MLGAPPAFVLSQDQTLNVDRIKISEKENLIILSEQLWRCFHRLMFLRNYFIGFLKESGFVRFAHSILFNFQVPHLSLPARPVRVAVSLTAYLFYHSFFPFVKRFLKISFRKFSKRSALLSFRKGFQSPLDLGFIWGSVSGGVTLSRGDLLILPHAGAFVNRKNELRRNR